MQNPNITHHGAVTGVTGSCHQYQTKHTNALIDCGLFQGSESNRPLDAFDFAVPEVTALIVTHCHIDHVGRIPWLIAAGFRGPIYCTEPTAALLPLVLEDALGIHIPDNADLVEKPWPVSLAKYSPYPTTSGSHCPALKPRREGEVAIRGSPRQKTPKYNDLGTNIAHWWTAPWAT